MDVKRWFYYADPTTGRPMKYTCTRSVETKCGAISADELASSEQLAQTVSLEISRHEHGVLQQRDGVDNFVSPYKRIKPLCNQTVIVRFIPELYPTTLKFLSLNLDDSIVSTAVDDIHRQREDEAQTVDQLRKQVLQRWGQVLLLVYTYGDDSCARAQATLCAAGIPYTLSPTFDSVSRLILYLDYLRILHASLV